jgi:ethanolamine ammonia-lyase small subunit
MIEPFDNQHAAGVEADNWQALKALTTARIALGRTGRAIPLKEVLAFKLAHAHARDAVYSVLEEKELQAASAQFRLPVYRLRSKAGERNTYLQRPDLGRQLDAASKQLLQEAANAPADVALILADGLSATAVNRHAVPVLQILIPLLRQSGFSLTPLSIVRGGRVAIGDETGALLNAKFSLVLIGERPGLSSPDSLGAYLTYQPAVGLTDESRNCVSNIRPEGLGYQNAAEKIFYLIGESFRLQYSGVALKDNCALTTPTLPVPHCSLPPTLHSSR